MKASAYNYYHNLDDLDALVWNTMTGAIIHACPQEIMDLQEGRLECLTADRRTEFEENGVLIPDSRNELAELEAELADVAFGTDPEKGGYYRILTTTACNAACSYCYEQGVAVKSMDEVTAHQTAEFIACRQTHKPPLIEWFGGEPLVNHQAITLICRDLRASGIHYASKITTNGSLWTDDLIQTASELWNLRGVQITLDGVGAEHDEAKGMPRGSFARTIRSIHKLAETGMRVQIRVNHYEGQNHSSLIEWIADEFAHVEQVGTYVAPGYLAGSESGKEVMSEIHALDLILAEAGLAYRPGRILPGRRHNGCFACDPRNFTIAPDGKLYNCSHNMDTEQCVGDVWQGVANPEERQFLRRYFSAKCRACLLLPVCMGGCRAAETCIAPMTQCPPFKNMIDPLLRISADKSI